jgi:hypothetical protein
MTIEQRLDGWGLPIPTPLDETPDGKLRAGDTVHFTRTTSAWGEVHPRGATVTLTPEKIAATVDRTGRSWLDDVDGDDPRIARGPWPADQPVWVYGSSEWQQAREAASRSAWSHHDAVTRAQALAEVEHLYGPASTTSRTVNSAPDPSVRAAAEQDRVLREGGTRLRSSYAPGERVNP